MEINKFNVSKCQRCNNIIYSGEQNFCGECLFIANSKYPYLPHFIKEYNYIINYEVIDFHEAKEYKEYIIKIIKITNLESYFARLFDIIYEKNKENIDINEPLDMMFLFEEYLAASFKLLKEKSFILFKDINTFETNYTLDKITHKHSLLFQKYLDSILDCINYDTNLKNFLGINSSENPYFSEKSHLFLQKAVTVAFSIFNERFLENISNKKYLNIEYYKDNIYNGLTLYLTPLGIINYKNYNKINKSSDYKKHVNHLLNDINIKYCSSLNLSVKFESDSFIIHNDTMYCQRKSNYTYFPELLELNYLKLFIKYLTTNKHINYIKL